MSERERMLQEIRKLSFAIQEVTLYLDGHANDAEALAYYQLHRDQKAQAVAAYEEKYGPLNSSGNLDSQCWKWATTPWPWEEE